MDVKGTDDGRPVKVVFAGDTGVGKTCLIKAAVYEQFPQEVRSTVGPGFEKLYLEHDSKKIRFEIWDTAGQEQYRAFTASFLRNANAVILVFDLTGDDPYPSLSSFLDLFRHSVPEGFVLLLIGNKSDLREDRRISVDHAMELQRKLGAGFYLECSALTRDHVLEIFETIAADPNLRFADDPAPLPMPEAIENKQQCKC
jgi:small GTP-binding protein